MVVLGHLTATSRPAQFAATKGWSGKEPQPFAKVMRQVTYFALDERTAGLNRPGGLGRSIPLVHF